MKNTIYSVKDLNAYIKRMFSTDFLLQRIYVKGEISNCKYHPSSGHIYFSLKDESGMIACVMFNQKRQTGLSFRMQNGDKVIILGEVSVYERSGNYQLYAHEVIREGAGELHERFEALKKELGEMGMFAPEYKQTLPRYARRVGIVTASSGAAIQDMKRVAYERNPYVQLILYPAIVQGEAAAASIVRGIEVLNRLEVDLIIIGRGGGSLEDLWAFNEIEVAKAIFHSKVPIISAVGHEPDVTIADYVADVSRPTPTAAAIEAVFDLKQTQLYLDGMYERLTQVLQSKITHYKTQINQYYLHLKASHPRTKVHKHINRHKELETKLKQWISNRLLERQHTLEVYARRLEGLSPVRKLASGFSYAQDIKGQNIRSIQQVTTGDLLELYVTDGKIRTKVLEVEP